MTLSVTARSKVAWSDPQAVAVTAPARYDVDHPWSGFQQRTTFRMAKSNGRHPISFETIAKAAIAFAWMYATCWTAVGSECPQAQEISQRAGKMIIAGFFGTRASDIGFQQILSDLDSGTIGGVLIARAAKSRWSSNISIRRPPGAANGADRGDVRSPWRRE